MVGLARCIAMVIVWNDLTDGDPGYCAGWWLLTQSFRCCSSRLMASCSSPSSPGWLDLGGAIVHVTIGQIAESVGIYLGVPFVAGIARRKVLTTAKGKAWYRQQFIPKIKSADTDISAVHHRSNVLYQRNSDPAYAA
jgi:ACR3 family arsenite transporter